MTKRRRLDPSPLKELVPGILRGIRGPQAGAVGKVRGAWAGIVGPSVAGRTRVCGVEGGRVRIEVESAALKHDLATFRRAEILTDLQKRLPDLALKEISFRVGTPS